MKYGNSPFVKAAVNMMFLTGNRANEFFVNITMSCIDAAVADHFEMLFRDMLYQPFDEIQYRHSFHHINVIFMAVVVEGDAVTVIVVNAGSGDNRPSKVAPEILGNYFGVTFIRLGIDIKAMLMVFITGSLYFFKRRAEMSFQFIEKSSAKGIAKVRVIEVLNISPEAIITVASFRDQAMDMRIPFKITTESM